MLLDLLGGVLRDRDQLLAPGGPEAADVEQQPRRLAGLPVDRQPAELLQRLQRRARGCRRGCSAGRRRPRPSAGRSGPARRCRRRSRGCRAVPRCSRPRSRSAGTGRSRWIAPSPSSLLVVRPSRPRRSSSIVVVVLVVVVVGSSSVPRSARPRSSVLVLVADPRSCVVSVTGCSSPRFRARRAPAGHHRLARRRCPRTRRLLREGRRGRGAPPSVRGSERPGAVPSLLLHRTAHPVGRIASNTPGGVVAASASAPPLRVGVGPCAACRRPSWLAARTDPPAPHRSPADVVAPLAARRSARPCRRRGASAPRRSVVVADACRLADFGPFAVAAVPPFELTGCLGRRGGRAASAVDRLGSRLRCQRPRPRRGRRRLSRLAPAGQSAGSGCRAVADRRGFGAEPGLAWMKRARKPGESGAAADRALFIGMLPAVTGGGYLCSTQYCWPSENRFWVTQ